MTRRTEEIRRRNEAPRREERPESSAQGEARSRVGARARPENARARPETARPCPETESSAQAAARARSGNARARPRDARPCPETERQIIEQNQEEYQEEVPPISLQSMLEFEVEASVQRFEILRNKYFEASRRIDWRVLEVIGLAAEVRELISTGGWDRLFNIQEPAYNELTLEVLSTFSAKSGIPSYDTRRAIVFRMGGRACSMSITQFSICLGLYTEEYTRTQEYKDLPRRFPDTDFAAAYWDQIAHGGNYNPQRSKASRLRDPALRYIHKLVVHTINGRSNSNGVVTKLDMVFLRSMREREPLHLGILVRDFLESQANKGPAGAIYAGPYITRLAKGLGIYEDLPAMTLEWRMAPIDSTTLRAMGIIERRNIQGHDYYVRLGEPVAPERNVEGEREEHAEQQARAEPRQQPPVVEQQQSVGASPGHQQRWEQYMMTHNRYQNGMLQWIHGFAEDWYAAQGRQPRPIEFNAPPWDFRDPSAPWAARNPDAPSSSQQRPSSPPPEE